MHVISLCGCLSFQYVHQRWSSFSEGFAFPLMPDTETANLPFVDVFNDGAVWAVLDEGCSSTCYGIRWARDAEVKFNMHLFGNVHGCIAE